MALDNLTTEQRNPCSESIDTLTAIEIVRLMNAEDARVAEAVGREAASIARAIDLIADRLSEGGRLVCLGAGTSGRLGVLDAAECPPTFSTPPGQVIGLIAGGSTALTQAIEGAEDRPQSAVEDLQSIQFSSRDVLVGIATSGRTPYVIGGLQYARDVGALTIGLSCNRDSQLEQVSQLMITPVVGPEVISGSTRLKAGTATKMVLNMLTTGVMIRRGKTYGNLMVDLCATNQKLAMRSRRIIMMLTALSEDQADAILKQCEGEVKTAVVAHSRGVGPTQARELLSRAGGHLRTALEGPCGAAPNTAKTDGNRADEDLVMGIDGGGSTTVVWLAAAGPNDREISPIGQGQAGPCNPQSVGWRVAQENLQRAVDAALGSAGRAPGRVASACVALAGGDREGEQQQIAKWAQRRQLARQVCVVNDATAVLASAASDTVGVCLISGTGSIAFGQDAQGRTARAGGWGYLLGDEGSSYAIALAALQSTARALDGRADQTALCQLLVDALGFSQPADLIQLVYQHHQGDRAWIASLARFVFAAAEQQDPVGRAIIDQAADQLASAVRAVVAGLEMDPGGYLLALSGGALIHHALLRDSVMHHLAARQCVPATHTLVTDPVAGAVVLARRRCTKRDC